MTREQIKEHFAEIVKCVFMAESKIRPTLFDRKVALGENPTSKQMEEMGDKYCLDIAEEIILHTPDEELNKLYKD